MFLQLIDEARTLPYARGLNVQGDFGGAVSISITMVTPDHDCFVPLASEDVVAEGIELTLQRVTPVPKR
jgi:hypothetical protein